MREKGNGRYGRGCRREARVRMIASDVRADGGEEWRALVDADTLFETMRKPPRIPRAIDVSPLRSLEEPRPRIQYVGDTQDLEAQEIRIVDRALGLRDSDYGEPTDLHDAIKHLQEFAS